MDNNAKLKSELLTVTPEIAITWLTENNYAKQRNISQPQVDFLAAHMRDGTFRQGTQVSFAKVGADGKLQLVNGQHTLSAIVKSGVSQLLSILYHEKENQKDVDWLYTQEDRNRARSFVDTVKVLELPRELELTRSQTRAVASASKMIIFGFRRNHSAKIKDITIIEKMREFKRASLLYFDLVDGCEKEIKSSFYRSTTLGIGLATCYYATETYGKEKVIGFWEGTALDDGLKKNDPRKSLLHHLRHEILGVHTLSLKKRVPVRYAYHRVAECWNAWAQDQELSLDPIVEYLSSPIHVLGTPYTDPERIEQK